MSILQKALGTEKGINITNMGLMLFSSAVAFMIPFKLFLFVYAVLGPLHYLTEISWLDRKKYFIEKKWQVWPYVLIALLLTVSLFNDKSSLKYYSTTLMVGAVVYTLFITLTKKYLISVLTGIAVIILCLFFKIDRMFSIVLAFSVFLPTIVHVFLFTGVFVLYGALKNKSTSGFISIAVFILCALSFVFLKIPNAEILSVAERGFIQRYFIMLNESLADLFGVATTGTKEEYFTVPALIAIQRFIAFAYTYHYLNWFSKTTIIKWHEVSKTRMSIIIAFWLLSVAAYYIDYRLGFMVLFTLSMLHVFLEFPLNVVSFRGIGQEAKKIFFSK
ncbi:MAG TPA: hypothetical protein VNZ49_06120 [Bacteroidia bacterium]|jgi:hypothetical protein|nr:hypothetical protein [Bacteroidia bacterium]